MSFYSDLWCAYVEGGCCRFVYLPSRNGNISCWVDTKMVLGGYANELVQKF